MNGEDATASSRSPRGEPNGRSDVTLGSTWTAAPPHLLRFPTASERRERAPSARRRRRGRSREQALPPKEGERQERWLSARGPNVKEEPLPSTWRAEGPNCPPCVERPPRTLCNTVEAQAFENLLFTGPWKKGTTPPVWELFGES
eukprot:scaffold60_cov325-Pavlova_lutheri.AAC.2